MNSIYLIPQQITCPTCNNVVKMSLVDSGNGYGFYCYQCKRWLTLAEIGKYFGKIENVGKP